jgi:hypothetical protein
MTASAATLERSAGRTVPDCSAVTAGDGGPGGISRPPGLPSSRLDGLKKERSDLRARLGRMRAARDELAAPARALDNIEAEQRAAESDIAGALSAWAQSGCDGHRPVPNAALAPASPGAGKQLGPN